MSPTAPPWPRIPSHLLNASSVASNGARYYSSDSQDKFDKDKRANNEERRPSLISSLGFQSLSSLFSTPPQARYSRPPAETGARSPTLSVKQDDAPAETRAATKHEKSDRIDLSFFNTGLSKPAKQEAKDAEKAEQAIARPKTGPSGPGTKSPAEPDRVMRQRTMFKRIDTRRSKAELPTSEEPQKELQAAENPFIPKPANEDTSMRLRRYLAKSRRQRPAGGKIMAPVRAGSIVRRPWGAHPALAREVRSRVALPTVGRELDGEQTDLSTSPVAAPHAPNPFAESSVLYRSLFRPDADAKKDQKPWGLDEPHTVARLIGPASETGTITSLDQEEHQAAAKSPRRTARRARLLEKWRIKSTHASGDATKQTQPIAVPGHVTEITPKLTHLKSTGEAHMVDVGVKAATKRIAIAYSAVRFSNQETHNQIVMSQNKKGDVLGTARIAGIMAAKKTSDLVPLCHPVALSRVDVDCTPITPLTSDTISGKMAFGGVSIYARADCIGPTGVEMEALTAAMTASLTVYDMCKAVDRSAKIRNTRLVYKSGGRSGVFADRDWLRAIEGSGPNYWEDHGLERPANAVSPQGVSDSEEHGDSDGDNSDG